MSLRALVFLGLGVFVLSLNACRIANVPPPGIEGAQFDDIPAPPNFAQDNINSYGHIFATFRVYTLVYRGKAWIPDVVDFYKSIMPHNSWRLVSETKDPACLTYTNGIERCEIRIFQERSETVARIDCNLN